MPRPRLPRPLLLTYLLKWSLLAGAVAVVAGSASAFFLWALDAATVSRETHRRIVWLLPLAGFAVGWIYWKLGKSVEGGNNLLIDEIHDPKKTVPLRMVPLVLGGTLVSHLFGASVGREGTAVQMGGALADQLSRLPGVSPDDRRILLMAGIAAGFASVFGTPRCSPACWPPSSPTASAWPGACTTPTTPSARWHPSAGGAFAR